MFEKLVGVSQLDKVSHEKVLRRDGIEREPLSIVDQRVLLRWFYTWIECICTVWLEGAGGGSEWKVGMR